MSAAEEEYPSSAVFFMNKCYFIGNRMLYFAKTYID